MSRIGKKPVAIPAGVTVTIDKNHITVKGPKGTLERDLNEAVNVKVEGNEVIVSIDNEQNGNLHGLTRTLISNMIEGVEKEFTRTLQINGVGYRAQKQGKKLVLTLGYSHPVEIEEVEGITIEVPAQNQIIVKGCDKQLVGQIAANIREKRLPEPYKGKGIKYADERIRRKEGKAGGKK